MRDRIWKVVPIQELKEYEERRSSVRVPTPLQLFESETAEITTRNISASGAQIACNIDLPKSSILPLCIRDERRGTFLSLNGKIVWSRKSREFPGQTEHGLAFGEVGTQEMRHLRYLLYRLASNSRWSRETLLLPLSLADDQIGLEEIANRIVAQQMNNLAETFAERCAVISPRPLILWKWCQEGIAHMTLSCVPAEWYVSVQTLKLLASMFFVTIDDIADDLKDKVLLKEVFNRVFKQQLDNDDLPFVKNSSKEIDILSEMWSFIKEYIRSFPRYMDFRSLFFFDYSNLLRGIEHAMLVNENPSFINELEALHQQAYEVHILPNLTLDLMCSPDFDVHETGVLREIAWQAQTMCRISNWLATWRKEVKNRDYTSGLIAVALKQEVISLSDLQENNSDSIIQKIECSQIQDDLLCQWGNYWTQIKQSSKIVQAVDVGKYLKGVEYFFQIQVACNSVLYDNNSSSLSASGGPRSRSLQ